MFGTVPLIAGIKKIKTLVDTILWIDKTLAKGKYNRVPSLKWLNESKNAILTYGKLAIDSNKIFPLVSLIAGIKKIKMITEAILWVDKTLVRGSYTKTPTQNWLNRSKSSILQYGFLAMESNKNFGLIGLLLGLNALGALLQVITNLRDVSMPRLVGTNLTIEKGEVLPNTELLKQTQNRVNNAFGIRKHIAMYELEMLNARKERVDASSIGPFDSTFSYIQIQKKQIIKKGQEVANSLYGINRLSKEDTLSILNQIDAQAKRAAMDAFKKSNGEMSNLDYQQRYYTEVFIRLNAVSSLNPQLETKAPSIIKNIIRTLEDTSIMVSREGIVVDK